MRPGRARPGYIHTDTGEQDPGSGFNEAGARAPRIPLPLLVVDGRFSESFNEAGARAPRIRPGLVVCGSVRQGLQ